LITKGGYVSETVADLRGKFNETEMAELKKYRGTKNDTPRIRGILAAGLNRIVCEGNSRYYDFNNLYKRDNFGCPRPPKEAAAIDWEKTNRKLLDENFGNYFRTRGNHSTQCREVTADEIYENYPKQTNRVGAIKAIEQQMKAIEPSFLFIRTKQFKQMIGYKNRFVQTPEKWYSEENYRDPKSWEQWTEREKYHRS